MQTSTEDFSYLLTSYKDELTILSQIIYKLKNQQRRNPSQFKHIEGIKRYSKKLFINESTI